MDEGRNAYYVQRWKCSVLLLLLAAATPVEGNAGGSLYPYGQEAEDTSMGNIGTHETTITLPFPIKYYGTTYNTAYILKDGMVALEPGVRYLDLEWREGTPNPAIDRPFIAPFHYNGFVPLIDPQAYQGKIYYNLMSRAGPHITISMKERTLMNEVDDYLNDASVVMKSGFRSLMVLKVTWENVSSADDCDHSQLSSSGCPSNTFQVLIAADRENTFAIFNYYKLETPFTVHQLAGLNGGHGRGWTDVIPCTGLCAKRSKGDKKRIKSLVTRVGTEMEVYPRQTGMFGGEMLSVSGTCSQPGTKIYCRFGGSDQAKSEGVMETAMRGRCPVPILTTMGEVLLELSTDNVTWRTMTYITIIYPARMPLPVNISDILNAWYEVDPKELKLRWTWDLFSPNQAATLDINLIGYREDKSSQMPIKMKTLVQLATNVLNLDGKYTVDPSQFNCTGSDCHEFELAFLQLRLADRYVGEMTKYQAVTVGPVTIGWYVKNAMVQRYGQNWSAAKCRSWNDRDRLSSAWLTRLVPCPCTLSQALADWGRFQAAPGCSMFAGSVCTYHTGAIHCVRSVHPSLDSSGNQCCYGADGNLRYAADTYQGSTPDRSHSWGAAPFGAPDLVPSMSHWIHDVVTFYYCCLWVEYKQCSYYMDRRATRDCKEYHPPDSAVVFGDPHIKTFDGTSYHFGGAGDFWLVKSDRLNVQGRFEERDNEVLQINTQQQLTPTNLTSLVMWTPISDVITIKLAPPGGPANRKLDVIVGTRRRFFSDSRMLWQDFKNVSVVNNMGTAFDQADKQHSNFTVLFVGGAAVQVAERQGLLHVIVTLPPESGLTEGLLGTRDGDATNDCKNPQGDTIPVDAQDDTLYLEFSKTWSVSRNENRFHWPKTLDERSPLFGDAKTFTYKPGMEDRKPSDSQVAQVCGDSQACRRDYYVSSEESVARASKKTEESFEALRFSQTKVRTCEHLNIPMSEKSSTVYMEGSVVRITGCRPHGTPMIGTGPLTYICNASDLSEDPVWMPKPNPDLCPRGEEETKPEKAMEVGLIVGIAVGVVVIIVIVIIVVVILRGGQAESVEERADRPVPTKRSKVPADIAVDPSTDEQLLRRQGRDAVKMSEVITEIKGRSKSEESV
ncbi:hypothetical protein ACOMHN_017851 [Nucella lapillus]